MVEQTLCKRQVAGSIPGRGLHSKEKTLATYHETSPLLPKGEALRKAIRYAQEHGLEWNSETVDRVAQQYDLSPLDTEFLLRQFVQKRGIST